MRVVPLVILLASLCTLGSGCALFGKKKDEGSGGSSTRQAIFPTRNKDSKPSNEKPLDNRDPLLQAKAESEKNSQLAGRVVDGFTGQPSAAYIRWEPVGDPKSGEAPIDIEVPADGYFTIAGLRKGARYKLTARTKVGERMLANTLFATAPDIHLYIKLSAQQATPETPPLPSPGGMPPPPLPGEGDKKQSAAPNSSWDTMPKGVNVPVPPARDFAIGRPEPLAPKTPPPAYPPGIAKHDDKEKWNGGTPNIRTPPRSKDSLPLPLPPSAQVPNPTTATAVPSCVLVGKQLHNLALREVGGATWEWRANRRGKLVLLDFWATDCMPCRQGIPHLRILQQGYGPMGLEVIGISCERNPSEPIDEQRHRIARLAQQQQTNYRLLHSESPSDPVRQQFAIRALPTLVLLDESGTILWRFEGGLQRHDYEALENYIKHVLRER